MIGVVIPTLNQQALAYEALASIKTEHNWQPFIIPNWRLGWSVAHSWNEGCRLARLAGMDYIAVLNDDILLAPYILDRLLDVLDSNEESVMATACNQREGHEPEEMWSWPEERIGSLSENPDFACFMIRQNFIDEIGRFDENFYPAYFEDNDTHRRILLAGKKAYNVSNAAFYHYGSKTQNATSSPACHPIQFNMNQAYYCNKWGGMPESEIYDRPFNNLTMTYKDWIAP